LASVAGLYLWRPVVRGWSRYREHRTNPLLGDKLALPSRPISVATGAIEGKSIAEDRTNSYL